MPQLRVIADETLIGFNDYMKWFHGFPYQRIGIDIFPLDYISRDKEFVQVQKTLFQQGMELITNWNDLEQAGKLEEGIRMFELVCNVKLFFDEDVKNKVWRLIDSLASLCGKDEADYLTNYTYWLDREHYIMKKEWYDEVVMLPFENIEIAVPAKYHEVLVAQFGDYMVPIQEAGDHNYPFYGHMENELVRQIRAVGFNGSVEEFCQAVSSGKLTV